MAKITLIKGRRAKMLAELISSECPGSKVYVQQLPDVADTVVVEGSCLVLTKNMVKAAYFDEEDMDDWVSKLFTHIAMNREGIVLCNTSDKIVIADSNEEKTMLLRMRPDQQNAVSVYSEKLGISRNEFVQKAIEFYSDYLKALKNDDANSFPFISKIFNEKE